MEIEALTDAEAEAAFFTIIGMFDKLGCAPGGTFEKKEDAGVTFRLHFNVERVRRLLAATRPTTASASEVTDAMIEAAWCAHLEFLGKPASPFPSSRTDCRALYSAIHAAMQAARPTADLGEDGELVELSERLADTACVLRGRRMRDHAVRCASAAVALSKAADRIELYREALVEARSWIGRAEEDYCRKDVLQMIDEALSRSGG